MIAFDVPPITEPPAIVAPARARGRERARHRGRPRARRASHASRRRC